MNEQLLAYHERVMTFVDLRLVEAIKGIELDRPGIDLCDPDGLATAIVLDRIRRSDLQPYFIELAQTWGAGAVDLFRRAKVARRDPGYVTEIARRVAPTSPSPYVDADCILWATAVWAYVAGFLPAAEVPLPPRPPARPPHA